MKTIVCHPRDKHQAIRFITKTSWLRYWLRLIWQRFVSLIKRHKPVTSLLGYSLGHWCGIPFYSSEFIPRGEIYAVSDSYSLLRKEAEL